MHSATAASTSAHARYCYCLQIYAQTTFLLFAATPQDCLLDNSRVVSIAMSFGFTVFVLVYVAAAFSGKLLLLLLLHIVLIACSIALMWGILLFSRDQQSLQKFVSTQFNLAQFNSVTIVLHVMLACNVKECLSVMPYARMPQCLSQVKYEAQPAKCYTLPLLLMNLYCLVHLEIPVTVCRLP